MRKTYRNDKNKTSASLEPNLGCLPLSIVLLVCLGILVLAVLTPDSNVDYYKLDKKVDRLIAYEFMYGNNPPAYPCVMTEDADEISRYLSSYKWVDCNNICCDERTTHHVYAYLGDQIVYSNSYAGVGSGYNNFGFTLAQWRLVKRMENPDSAQWCYAFTTPSGTDPISLRAWLQEETGWYIHGSSAITPRALSREERDEASRTWGITFTVDAEAEAEAKTHL